MPDVRGAVKKTVDGTKSAAGQAWDDVKEHPGGAVTGAVVASIFFTPLAAPVGAWVGAYISKKNS